MTKKQQQQNKKTKLCKSKISNFVEKISFRLKLWKKIHPQTSLRKQTNSKPKQQ